MDKGILRAKPPSVFFVSEEEKRSFCLNRVKPLKLPQPRTSVQVNLVLSLSLEREREREGISFFERKHPLIHKLMFITEPAVARTPPFKAWVPNYILATFRACSTELLFDSFSIHADCFSSTRKSSKRKKCPADRVG